MPAGDLPAGDFRRIGYRVIDMMPTTTEASACVRCCHR